MTKYCALILVIAVSLTIAIFLALMPSNAQAAYSFGDPPTDVGVWWLRR